METKLILDINPQPDQTTCGPTCLRAVYRFFDDPIPLARVISEVTDLEGGGTTREGKVLTPVLCP